jgi:hypothetical protein
MCLNGKEYGHIFPFLRRLSAMLAFGRSPDRGQYTQQHPEKKSSARPCIVAAALPANLAHGIRLPLSLFVCLFVRLFPCS